MNRKILQRARISLSVVVGFILTCLALTDDESAALWLYLSSLPAVETKS